MCSQWISYKSYTKRKKGVVSFCREERKCVFSLANSWCLKDKTATLGVCQLSASTKQNKCCFFLSTHLEKTPRLLRELVHLKDADSHFKVAQTPSSLLSYLYIKSWLFMTLSLLLFPSIYFPTLCEGPDKQCFSQDRLWSSYIFFFFQASVSPQVPT